MRKLFGKRYIGIVQWKSAADMPKLKEGQVVLLHKDLHWTAAYKKNGVLVEIDSFARDLLGAQYKDQKLPKSFLQPITETDCGQRTLTILIKEAL